MTKNKPWPFLGQSAIGGSLLAKEAIFPYAKLIMKKAIFIGILGVSLVLPNVLLASHDGSFSSLSVSQNNVFLNVGQTASVTTFPPNNATVNVFSISNTSVVNAYMNGTVLNLTGNGSGFATVRVCTSDLHCANISVTVSGSGTSGSLSFSPSSATLSVGSNTSVTVFNNTSQSLYVSSYVASIASVQLSGNTLFITGVSQGSMSATVCALNASICANLPITVIGSSTQVTLSPNNVSLSVGQSTSISISGGSSYFIFSNSNSSVASAFVSGSSLTVNALALGTSQIMVCAVGTSQCAVAVVNVIGAGSVSLNPTSVSLNVGQSTTVSISGLSPFYILTNTNISAVSANVSGSTLNITGLNSGSGQVTVCTFNSSSCASVSVNVGGSSNLFFLTTSLNNAPINNSYSAQILASGSPPFNFSLNSGTLPPGLTLSSSGFISGIPYSSGSYNFTVRLQDASGRTAFQIFTLQVTGSVLGSLIYNNGTLINDSGTIWLTYKNSKAGFANMSAFLGLGYRTESVINGSTAGLVNTGFVINSASIPHPWGSWIRSGNTVYFVHESGLIPISQYDIFISNGGRDNLVVNGNQFDYNRTMLPLMTINDSRLRP